MPLSKTMTIQDNKDNNHQDQRSNEETSGDVHRGSDNGDDDQRTEKATTARTDLPLDQLKTNVISNYSHGGRVATSIQQEAMPRDVDTAENDAKNHDSTNATMRQDLERMRQEQKETSQMQTLLQLEQQPTVQSQQEQQIEPHENMPGATTAQVLASLHQNGRSNAQPQARQEQSEDAGKHCVLQSPQEFDDSLRSRLTTTEEGGLEPPRLTRNRNMIANSGIPGAYAVAPLRHRDDNDNFISDDDPGHHDSYHSDNNDVAAPAAMTNMEQGLAQAQPIMEDEKNRPTAVGTPTMPQHVIQEMRDQKFRAWYKKILVLFLLMFGTVIAIVIGLTVKNNTQDDDGVANFTNALTGTPSLTPTLPPAPASTPYVLPLPDYTLKAMMANPESPQAMAYKWLKEDPFLQEYSESKLAQRFALATFYYATGGSNWTFNDNWLSYNASECSWFSKCDAFEASQGGYVLNEMVGLKWLIMTQTKGQSICDTDGNYIELVLHTNELVGSLPAELSFLSRLEKLDIAKNQLSNTLPTEIEVGLMSSLEILGLTWTFLASTIPSELGQLTSLKELWWANSPGAKSLLTGSVPTEVSQMRNLSVLVMKYTGIAGSLPTQIGLLSQLKVLDLWHNQISHIPQEMFYLTNLKFIRYMGNLVTGSIPSEFGKLTNLELLDISDNLHTGKLPSELGLSQSLATLILGNNDLSGIVPEELFSLLQLDALSLGPNLKLRGTIPSTIGNLEDMFVLDVSGTNFVGTIPSEVGLLSSAIALRFAHTSLTGTLPTETSQLSALIDLNLEGSEGLIGTLPPFPQNQSFWGVKLNGTSLTGTVPDNLCDLLWTWFDCTPMCGCDCVCPNDKEV